VHIGQLAARSGTTAKAIRYYERIGLLDEPERTPAGYRRYSEADARRLEFIAIAKGAGLSLDEIAEVLRASTRSRINCDQVCTLLERKLLEIRERLADMQALHDALDHTVAAARHHELPPSEDPYDCPIIERTVHERRELLAATPGERVANGRRLLAK
jgi:MerR family copper efflux transcriptional regulator